jgi:hypothetical protein
VIVEINMDSVVVNGVTVTRPARVPRSQWLRWWEEAKAANSLKEKW